MPSSSTPPTHLPNVSKPAAAGASAFGAAGAPAPDSPEHAAHAAVKKAEPAHFLQKIKLFSTLTKEDCEQVVKRMRRRDFPPNTTIVREGAPGSSMFFITSGLVEVRK